MNILITGGLGYIGSGLIQTFNINYDITVVDNLYTQRYCSLFNRKRSFKFIEDNFANLSVDFLKKYDYVIHLAAIVDAANSDKQADLVHDVNVYKTRLFIEKCKEAKVRFIFPSSTSVYGKAVDVVYEDDTSVLNPQSVYAKCKLNIEDILRKDHIDHAILRLGTVCGVSPGIRFQTCINKFCYYTAIGMPIPVWRENINYVRPYLSLQDLKRTIIFAINNWDLFSKETFNILTENLSTQNIIDKISGVANPEIIYVDCPLLNQFSYNVSNKKIINKTPLKFGEKFAINNDIDDTINLITRR